jgi:TolB-like protein/Tfp pilus assembly protein PilF
MRLNPFHYEWYTAQLGQIYFDARQYEKALSSFAKLRWMDSALMRIYQAASFAALDRFDEARASVRRILQLDPTASIEKWTSKYLAPYARQDDINHLRSALRKAGLPETAQIVTQQTSERPSIAVLPFDNLTGDPSHDLICDGISRNITDDLARFRDLFVVASDSAFVYRDSNGGIQAISRSLGVRYVLAGSIMLSGNQLKIQPRLIDGRSGQQVWSQRYEGPPESIFSLQDSLTSTIASTLATAYGGQLLRIWQRRPERAATRSMTAIDLFHRGMEKLNRFTNEDNEAARKLFAEAASHDSNYAKPVAKIAWTYLVEVMFGWARDVPSSLRHSQEYAQKAVLIDPDEPWGYWSLAGQYQFQGDFDRAIASYERALEINPNDADVMTDFGWCLSFSGRPEEGLAMALKAIKLNPHHPDWYIFQLAQLQFNARKYGDAIKATRRLREVDATIVQAYLAASYAALDYRADAERAIMRLLQLDPVASVERYTSPEMATYRLDADLRHFRDCLSKAGLQQSVPVNANRGSGRPSIAVLPFLNISGNPQQDYIADGITEDIINELGRFSSLTVIGRSSSFHFRGGATDAKTVGKSLGSQYLVDGSLRWLGDRVRISAQLIDSATGKQLWSERYDRPLEDFLAVQDDVVHAIVATFEHRLADMKAVELRTRPQVNWVAYDFLLQARHYLSHYGDMEKAEKPLLQAIALDPSLVEAHARLVHVAMGKFWAGDGDRAHIAEAFALAKKALAVDNHDSFAHGAMSLAASFSNEFDLALAHADEALRLNANNLLAAKNRSVWLLFLGRNEEALVASDEVMRRDPYPPSNFWESRGAIFYQLGRYEEALAIYRRISNPQDWERAYIVASLVKLDRETAAKAELSALLTLFPRTTISRVLEVENYQVEVSRERLASALRAAGMPN